MLPSINCWEFGFASIAEGAFGSRAAVINTIAKTVPICFAALGVAVARQAGIFNIGINGQILIGSLSAALAGIYLEGLPHAIHLPLSILAGVLGAVLFALFPTVVFLRRKVNLLVIHILMNNIASLLVTWLLFVFFKDPDLVVNATRAVRPSARLTNILVSPAKLDTGLILVLISVILSWFFFYRTTRGLELRACGQNRLAASYAGIGTTRHLGGALLLGGVFAGLAGSVEVLGTYYRQYEVTS